MKLQEVFLFIKEKKVYVLFVLVIVIGGVVLFTEIQQSSQSSKDYSSLNHTQRIETGYVERDIQRSIPEVDLPSLVFYDSGPYMKDKNSVYCSDPRNGYIQLEGTHPATFSIIASAHQDVSNQSYKHAYAKDGSFIFYKCKKIIKANSKTFQVLGVNANGEYIDIVSTFAKDSLYIYKEGTAVLTLDPKTFQILTVPASAQDVSLFEGVKKGQLLPSLYVKDKNSVYCYNEYYFTSFKDADVKSFITASSGVTTRSNKFGEYKAISSTHGLT